MYLIHHNNFKNRKYILEFLSQNFGFNSDLNINRLDLFSQFKIFRFFIGHFHLRFVIQDKIISEKLCSFCDSVHNAAQYSWRKLVVLGKSCVCQKTLLKSVQSLSRLFKVVQLQIRLLIDTHGWNLFCI